MNSLPGKVWAYVIVRDSRRSNRLAVCMLIQGRIFTSLQQYLYRRNVSLSVEQKIARAVGLLLDFIDANSNRFSQLSERKELFNEFAHALRYGTISDGHDPSGLWWAPRRLENVKTLLQGACAFSDWLVEHLDREPLNPRRPSTQAEQIAFWRRWNTFRYDSLLAHTKNRAQVQPLSEVSHTFAPIERPVSQLDRAPYFPIQEFDRLLAIGMITRTASQLPWKQFKIRDMMVALLMHAGGLRISEPFHIWVNDVAEDPLDPTLAFVRVFHPSDGMISYPDPVTGRTIATNRAEYLATHCNRRPLNIESRYNGWKGNAIDRSEKCMPVFWYPRDYGRLFLVLFKLYLIQVRSLSLPHPWLFVTEAGDALLSKGYRKLHEAAVRRIGLVPAKHLGTTPHGHRHAYGQQIERAVQRGLLNEKIFMRVFHHNSLQSQTPYNQLEFGEVSAALNKANLEMGAPGAQSVMSLIGGVSR